MGKGTRYPKICAANTEGKLSALCRMKARTLSAVSTQEVGKVPKAGQHAPLPAEGLQGSSKGRLRGAEFNTVKPNHIHALTAHTLGTHTAHTHSTHSQHTQHTLTAHTAHTPHTHSTHSQHTLTAHTAHTAHTHGTQLTTHTAHAHSIG